jgi:transposase-like protein
MYSYEDRLRAVQLYIKLGKRVGLTIRQLGYPAEERAQELAPRVRAALRLAGRLRAPAEAFAGAEGAGC